MPQGAPVFVLDAESTDDTVTIARAHGATVEVRAWTGFVAARAHALARVTTPYAFMIDADELLDETLRTALEAPLDAFDGYRVARVTKLAGRAVHAAGWSAERLVRCFRTDRATVAAHSVGGSADLHERWSVDGTVGDLPGTIVHDSYPTIGSYFVKYARYTRIEAAAIAPSVARTIGALAIVFPRFVWLLLRYGGWRDGWRGAFVAYFSALYPFVVQCTAFGVKR